MRSAAALGNHGASKSWAFIIPTDPAYLPAFDGAAVAGLLLP